jgi:CAAX protease family protein
MHEAIARWTPADWQQTYPGDDDDSEPAIITRLQERYGPVAASLILGTLHGLWHLPVLFTAAYGPLPLANLLPFILTAAVTTVIYTWVYNRTQGSILIAMLFHASGNAAASWLTTLIARSDIVMPDDGLAGYLVETNWLSTLAYGVVALLLIVMTRGRLGIQDAQGTPLDETRSGHG